MVAQLLHSAACLHTNQSRSYLNHLVHFGTAVRASDVVCEVWTEILLVFMARTLVIVVLMELRPSYFFKIHFSILSCKYSEWYLFLSYFRSKLYISDQSFVFPLTSLYFLTKLSISDENFVFPIKILYLRSNLCISYQTFVFPVTTLYFSPLPCVLRVPPVLPC